MFYVSHYVISLPRLQIAKYVFIIEDRMHLLRWCCLWLLPPFLGAKDLCIPNSSRLALTRSLWGSKPCAFWLEMWSRSRSRTRLLLTSLFHLGTRQLILRTPLLLLQPNIILLCPCHQSNFLLLPYIWMLLWVRK